MSGGHKILSLARLPVPPRPHIKFSRPTYSTIFAILLQVLFLVFYKFFYGRALSGSNPLVYMHKAKQAPIGRLPCFGAVKGISKPRFARLPSCGSLFGHLGPRPVQMPTGHFHLRPCPFGFESPRLYAQNKTGAHRTPALFWCGQRDSNPHGLPHGPEPCASANSAMTA